MYKHSEMYLCINIVICTDVCINIVRCTYVKTVRCTDVCINIVRCTRVCKNSEMYR